ncbi:DUF72 domain-containing protein [Nitrosophilus kaiyonis]|uniref:DUF72 domain-containing protein n=1 Tax=Nitrosophilus kaiyonis TaxID=2930200 RepID=UPI0024923188|nr:DUF72 domain-containing protein [Nitrosophilus kaiyonis]
MIYIGIAGWNIPKEYKNFFPNEGTHLERYSKIFNITEINRTFYSLPKKSTLEKWFNSTPENFKFSVKMPKKITHISKIQDIDSLQDFLSYISILDNKLLSILVQLPPSLKYEENIAEKFFSNFRKSYNGYIALEARSSSWIEAEELLKFYKISTVAADPSRFDFDKKPGGWKDFSYYRLHGSPKIYYSEYDKNFLLNIAKTVKKSKAKDTVIIFDNTASGAAIKNALELKELFDEIK